MTVKYINGLVDLVYSNIQTLHSDPAAQGALVSPTAGTSGDAGDSASTAALLDSKSFSNLKRIEKFFLSTLKHIQTLKQKSAQGTSSFDDKQRWDGIVIDEVMVSAADW